MDLWIYFEEVRILQSKSSEEFCRVLKSSVESPEINFSQRVSALRPQGKVLRIFSIEPKS